MIDRQQLLTDARALILTSRELVAASQLARWSAKHAVARADDILKRCQAAADRRAPDGADRQHRREELVAVPA